MCSSTSSQSVTSSGRAMLNPLCQKIVAIPFREKAGVERKGTIVIAPMRARPQRVHTASRPFPRRRQADRGHALPEKSLLPPESHGPALRSAIHEASVALNLKPEKSASHHAKAKYDQQNQTFTGH